MREIRDEDEIEDDEVSMFSRRMTPKEIEDYFEEYMESLEESKVEKEEISSETDFDMTKKETQEISELIPFEITGVHSTVNKILESRLKSSLALIEDFFLPLKLVTHGN